MAKLTLTDITADYSAKTTINANWGLIETAMENTLSRDGTSPNTMSAVLDMNGNNVNNVATLTCDDAIVNGSSVSASAAAAAASAAAAATSETNAAASETAAAASEAAAGTSETNAAASASSASTSASNAATSETNAAASESAAATSESNASTSETNAAASASAASTSASNAATSETNAAASEAAAAASYDSFDDRYLGAKASDPTLDNDGNALLTGALYWNTTSSEMRAYDGASWWAAYLPAGAYTSASSNETITGDWSFTGVNMYLKTTNGLIVDNAKSIVLKESGGTQRSAFQMNAGNQVHVGNSNNLLTLFGSTHRVSDGTNSADMTLPDANTLRIQTPDSQNMDFGQNKILDHSGNRISLIELPIIKAATESVSSSTTFQADDDFVWTNMPVGIYAVEGNLRLQCSSSGVDFKMRFSTSGGFFTDVSLHYVNIYNATSVEGTGSISLPGTSTHTVTATVTSHLRITGIVNVSSSGTVTLEWAQNVSTATSMSILKGSFINFRRLD